MQSISSLLIWLHLPSSFSFFCLKLGLLNLVSLFLFVHPLLKLRFSFNPFLGLKAPALFTWCAGYFICLERAIDGKQIMLIFLTQSPRLLKPMETFASAPQWTLSIEAFKYIWLENLYLTSCFAETIKYMSIWNFRLTVY